MFQTLIVALIVMLAAVWVLKNAFNKLNPPAGSQKTACGCGCEGCNSSAIHQNKTGCNTFLLEKKELPKGSPCHPSEDRIQEETASEKSDH